LPPLFTIADDRSAGTACPACEGALRAGEGIALCGSCGAAHHRHCWERDGACSAYDCAPANRAQGTTPPAVRELVITTEQIGAAVPLAPRPQQHGVRFATPEQIAVSTRPKISRGAIAAAICAVGGIPLFGLVTGAVAVVLAALALGPIRAGTRRGAWIACAALVLGLVDVVGWAVLLSHGFGGRGVSGFNTADFRVSEADLRASPPLVAAALRANVLILRGGMLGGAIGSGVVCSVRDGSALILTNRHVASPDSAAEGAEVGVQFVDGRTATGKVVWNGPDGMDAALVRVEASPGALATAIDSGAAPHIGDDVFAVGNPRGLGWTHTKGSISQFRERSTGAAQALRVIQTSAPINPGNSGGGLYDAAGRLIGINTWAGDKRDSEGLGFAISLDSIRAVLPEWVLAESAKPPPAAPSGGTP
jgi:hypothetical protein